MDWIPNILKYPNHWILLTLFPFFGGKPSALRCSGSCFTSLRSCCQSLRVSAKRPRSKDSSCNTRAPARSTRRTWIFPAAHSATELKYNSNIIQIFSLIFPVFIGSPVHLSSWFFCLLFHTCPFFLTPDTTGLQKCSLDSKVDPDY